VSIWAKTAAAQALGVFWSAVEENGDLVGWLWKTQGKTLGKYCVRRSQILAQGVEETDVEQSGQGV